MPRQMSPREILEKLVAFPTVSSESNLALIDWVEDYLDGFGVKATRVYDDTMTKAALYAQVGPDEPGGVILSGHTDVVPVEGQDWATDPFEVTEKGGKLFGRGTADMKGFDALALAAVPKAIRAGLKRPLQIALSYDEEIGCLGAPRMIEHMAQNLAKAEAVIVGEPSRMKVVTGHKGSSGFYVDVRGHEVHSSIAPEGVSAVMRAASLIEWANVENARLRESPPSEIADMFYPPFTTVHIGTISGGTAHNITAKDCHFGVDWRFVPDDDAQGLLNRFKAKAAEVEAEMKAIHPDAGITMNQYFGIPPLKPEFDGRAEQLARQITGDNGTHTVSYGTEAGQFQEAGYSAVVCGPGDIAQAHQADEFIEISELDRGEAFLEKIIEHLRG